METNTAIYTERRTFGKYDAENIIGYLNEEQVQDYQPEGAEEPVTGYRYTGTERDGGTIMPCKDPTDYGQLVNAIIRASLTESEELAIHRGREGDGTAMARHGV